MYRPDGCAYCICSGALRIGCTFHRPPRPPKTTIKRNAPEIGCNLPPLLLYILILRYVDIAVVTLRCQTRKALTSNTVSVTLAHVPASAVCSFTLPARTPVHLKRYPRPRSRPGDGPALSSHTRSVLHTFPLYFFYNVMAIDR